MTKRTWFTRFRLLMSLMVIFLALGLTFVSCKPAQQTETVTESAPAPSASKADFAWTPAKPGVEIAQISAGRAVICPFNFTVKDASITKVALSVKDDKIAQMGVIIAEEEVDVVNGKAVSDAMFGIAPGTRLGNYKLPIVAKNAETGEIIGEGIIPFQIVPQGVGGC